MDFECASGDEEGIVFDSRRLIMEYVGVIADLSASELR